MHATICDACEAVTDGSGGCKLEWYEKGVGGYRRLDLCELCRKNTLKYLETLRAR